VGVSFLKYIYRDDFMAHTELLLASLVARSFFGRQGDTLLPIWMEL